MAEPKPTFAGEVQFRRYSDTSTQGTQIVLALPDREALQSFIGLEGKRFMAVLVQIGDDEQPVDASNSRDIAKVRKSDIAREPLGDLCWRAVQWCKEPEFHWWLASTVCPERPHDMRIDEEDAKGYILEWCGIDSRKELDTNPEAARNFHQHIRGPYQKHLIARGIVK